MIIGFVKIEKGEYEAIFQEAPKGEMRPLRSLIRHNKARMNRNASGGINIVAEDPRDPEAISNLVLDIEELGIGLSVDAETIPVLNLS